MCEVYAVNRHQLTLEIKRQAKQLGFDACGISKAEQLDEEARLLEAWLNQNLQGKMGYMQNHFDKRIDPRKLVDGARSVISLSYNYFTGLKQQDDSAPKIAMYALGKDYHEVLRGKLELLLSFIRGKMGEVNGRCFVDSAPVLEKAECNRLGNRWALCHGFILSSASPIGLDGWPRLSRFIACRC